MTIKKNKTERIGIFGGKFNPPHNAHLAIARQAKKQFRLDRIIFIPVFVQPGKSIYPSVNARQRLGMLKLAVKNKSGFEVSDMEIKRRSVSYTINTLRSIKKKLPQAELVLILGADNLAQFHLWKSYGTILKLASLAVYRRKGFNDVLNIRSFIFHTIKGNLFRFSSTDIRKRINNGLPILRMVPKSISEYIKEHSLYIKEEPGQRNRK